MRAKDLMIGNWVSFRRDFPDRIDGIAVGGVSVHLEHDGWGPIEAVQPIALTEDILKKNGWVNGQFYAEILLGGWRIMSDCEHVAARNEDGWCIDIPCRFVHELQHCLKLIGIDKQIEL